MKDNQIKNIFQKFNTDDKFSSFKYLAEGMENTMYKVFGRKQVYVLRVSKVERTYKDTVYEYRFISALRMSEAKTPRMFVTDDSNPLVSEEGVSYSLFEFIEGKHVKKLNQAQIAQIGRLMGKMHLLATDLRIGERLEDINHLSWLNDVKKSVLKGFQKDDEIAFFMWEVYESCTKYITENIKQVSKLPLHNDIHQGNLLFNNSGELVALIDFDEAHNHYIPLEIGWTLGEICNHGDAEAFNNNILILMKNYKIENPVKFDNKLIKSVLSAEFSRTYLKSLGKGIKQNQIENIIDLYNGDIVYL